MITVKAIDHICLWVRSLHEAKHYYERVFGFKCIPREGDETTLIAESKYVHLFISECINDYEKLSKQHLSFQVDSLDYVIHALNELGISNYQTGEVSFFTQRNYKWCEWLDPNGIRLECVELIDE